jgi:hypothetical protein
MKLRHFYHRALMGWASALILGGPIASQAQTLTVTTDLQLWLKADAGVTANDQSGVSAWEDQSGNNNHATQPTDTLSPLRVNGAQNGQPVLRFDGVDDYLSVADAESLSFTGDLTTFFVVKFDDFVTYRAVWAKTANNFPAPTDYYVVPGSGRPQVYRGNGTDVGIGSFLSTTALSAGSYLTVGFGIEGSTCSHFLGAQAASTGTLNATAADTDQPLLIGTRGDLFTKMKGDIAEILIYSRALTPTERASVADYLAQKYGIVNLLPTVSLDATPAGPTHAAGDILTLTANATDPDGTVANVKFFANGSLLGTATAAPYQIRVALETPGSYDLTAVATDNKDATGTSTTVSRTVSSGAEPTLGVTSSLQLWLKADAGVTTGDGGIVTTWQDQSGQANHATSVDGLTAPVVADAAVNSRPAIRFDGVDDRLDVIDSPSVSITGDLTSFFVVKMDDFATFRAVWAKTAGPSGNLPAPTDFYTVPNTGLPKVYRGDGTPANLSFVDGTRALRAGIFELVGFSIAGSSLTHYLGGSENGSGTVTTTTADGDTPLYLGTRHDQFTRLKGDLAEVLIYNTALSESERRQVQTYLAGRYGMTLATSVNATPTVALTAPAPGGAAVAPADVVVSADATDSDGSIVRVEFLVNGGVAATDTAAPFTATVNFPVASEAVIQARAVDNLGGVTVSAPVSFSVTAQEPIPLPALANLRLWLRADEGVVETAGAVSAWNDQSGNFNNAVQTTAARRPTLIPDAANGQPVLRFDGTDDSLVAPSSATLAITGDISTFFVVRFDDFANYRAVWAKTQNNLPASTDFYTLPNTGLPRVYRGNGAGSAGFSTGTVAPPTGVFAIVGFDQAGTTVHHYLNGDLNGNSEVTAILADTGAPLHVGTRGDQFTRMKGDIAEIVIYDTALSEADRGTVISYFGRRYGIPTTPLLTIVPNGDGTVTVSWPSTSTGWDLEVAADLQGPWTPIEFGVINNQFIDFIGERSFYRLRKQ